ncbi:MAG: FAD-dependent oxidoreductase, partial [Nocardioides sp.]
MPAEGRLLLVGAGHAHLHLIRHAERLRRAGYDITLVAPRWFAYSGAAASAAAGSRDPASGLIDIAALGRGRRLEHLDARAIGVDLDGRTVAVDDGRTLGWDVVSFNIGSVAAEPSGVPVDPSVVRVKPLSDLAAMREQLHAVAPEGGRRITVVGAGPSGIELAAQLGARPDVARVLLLESSQRPFATLPPRAARRLLALLGSRGVELHVDAAILAVGADAVTLADGRELPHDLAVLAAGLVPPPLAREPALGGPAGIPVRATLQHRDHDDVYAAGDCADFLLGRLARVGVHGVRQGPVLLSALEARGGDRKPPVYRPQRHALSILDLGAGTALAVRGRWWWLGRASRLLKERIDRRWLDAYR